MAHLREVEFKDIDDVAALHRDVGWPVPTLQTWQRLWIDNPALQGDQSDQVRGWVLEHGTRLVGFLCNLAQTYQFGERRIRAAVASAMVVNSEWRGEAMKLVTAFARQPNVDLLLNTTAARQTSKIFEYFKFRRIPHPGYDLSYYWVLKSAEFLRAALLKKAVPKALSEVVGVGLAPFLRAEMIVRRRRPRASRRINAVEVISADEVSGEFDDLWERRLAESKKLLAERRSTTLRWHYAAAGRTHPAKLLCARNGSQLVGYAAVVRRDSERIGLKRAFLADIFVERDNSETIELLLGASVRQARLDGAAMIEAVGFPENVRQIFRASCPFELRNESWPFLYSARDSELHESLTEPSLWYPCLFDGDGSI
jgi:hypothetical protein